ncbi:MAG TPA: hypothetical protein VEF76_13370 [Patescibacteria group bacterium]|nr:hypothetical protein [Patescibacteria group bacterium]
MDKRQKQELDEVLQKYNRPRGAVAKSYLRSLGKGAVVGVAADLLFTAGFGTLAAVTAASYPALKATGRGLLKNLLAKSDTRVQRIEASLDIQLILLKITAKLSSDFHKAVTAKSAIRDPGKTSVAEFYAAAAEAREDVRRLSPAFKIVSGGTNNYGTAEYKILVHRLDKTAIRATGILTLDEAIAVIDKKVADDSAQPRQISPPASSRPANDSLPPPRKKPGFNL